MTRTKRILWTIAWGFFIGLAVVMRFPVVLTGFVVGWLWASFRDGMSIGETHENNAIAGRIDEHLNPRPEPSSDDDRWTDDDDDWDDESEVSP